MSLLPQFGHSSSAPPSGNSGFDGSKKFIAFESSIMECVNSKLQSSHRRVQRAIAIKLQPYGVLSNTAFALASLSTLPPGRSTVTLARLTSVGENLFAGCLIVDEVVTGRYG
jgi:hypothetical protein